MASYGDIELKVIDLAQYIDGMIQGLEVSAGATQKAVYEIIRTEMLRFDISNGSYVKGQDLRARLATMQNKIESALGTKSFQGSIRDFLTDFSQIQAKTAELHKFASDVEIPKKELSPARQVIQERATEALTRGLANEYVEPAKRLMANQVMTGASISDSVKLLEKWNDGDLSSGRETQGVRTPDLKRYATQVARDTAYSVQRSTNDIFRDKFGMQRGIYQGGLVADSRPLCKHLVGLNRPIELDELPPLIQAFPQGLYPVTNSENFPSVCGGYNCQHLWLSII